MRILNKMFKVLKMFDFNKIKPDRFLAYFFIVLALTIPGIGMLYSSNSDLMFKLETFKFIAVSVLLSTPIFLIGSFCASWIVDFMSISKGIKKEPNSFVLMYLYSITTLIIFCGVIAMKALLKYNYPSLFINKLNK